MIIFKWLRSKSLALEKALATFSKIKRKKILFTEENVRRNLLTNFWDARKTKSF